MMQLLAVGATARLLAALAEALKKGPWEHLAESAQAADEFAALIEFGVGWHI